MRIKFLASLFAALAIATGAFAGPPPGSSSPFYRTIGDLTGWGTGAESAAANAVNATGGLVGVSSGSLTSPTFSGTVTFPDTSTATSSGFTHNAPVSVAAASFGLTGNQSASGIFGTSGIRYKNVAGTLNDTTSSGTIAANYDSVFGGNTLTATSATTITNDYGSYFKAPICSTNVTCTNNFALGADSLAVNGTTLFNADAVIHTLTIGLGGGSIASNSAFGVSALQNNTTGSYNSAQGAYALYSNTTGSYNSAQGRYALYSNTTGSSNSAQGVNALYSNTTGGSNSAQGRNALYSNTIGSSNSAQGVYALYDLGAAVTAGSFVSGISYTILTIGTTDFTLIGAASNTVGLAFTATGAGTGTGTATPNTNNNTAIGYNTARGITYGSSNTIVGAQVTGLAAGLSNTVIFADGTGNIRFNSPSTGQVQLTGAYADLSYSYQTPSTGATITVGKSVGRLILNPAGTLASLTVNMPATPIDGQTLKLSCTQIVTTLTMSGNGHTLEGGLTALTADNTAEWTYVLSATTWFRTG